MASKKATSTKSTKSKKGSKSTTSKKTEPKMVNLTFAPILSAADQFSALLRQKIVTESYGTEIVNYAPKIEGLPMILTVRKNEIYPVTEEQFAQLQDLGLAETDEEYKAREKFIDELSEQHPRKLTWEMILAEGSNFATLYQSQFVIYNDKLLRV